jgi:hypothetical protein
MSEKSILEQALLQVQTLEEAVKQNAKGILASTMKQELSDLLKESMEEEEEMNPMDEAAPEEEEKDDMSGEEESDDEADEEGDEDTETEPENDEEDLDNEPSKGIDDLDSDSDMDDMEHSDGEDEDDTMDMTHASDDEVLKVFKAMKPQDGIVVKKDGNNVEFGDGEDEYIIKLDDEESEPEMTDEEWDESTDSTPPMEGNMMSQYESDDSMDEDMMEEKEKDDDEDEDLYEIEIDEEEYAGAKGNHPDKFTYAKQKGGYKEDKAHANPAPHTGKVGDTGPFTKVKTGGELKGGHPTSTKGKEQDMDESSRTLGYGYHGGLKSKKVAKAGNKREEMNESLQSQVNSLKKQNGEYKKALVLFKEKLNEVAVFNASLAYATRLFTEHSTTKQEKMNILKRFDSASSLNESKGLYETIKTELGTKTTVTESVVNKISAAPQSSSTEVLSEAKAYENPQFKRMKDLMSKIK